MGKPTLAQRVAALEMAQSLAEEHRKKVEEHDKILVRGDNGPSLQEDVREIKRAVDKFQFWFTAIGLSFIGQVVVSMWYLITHIMPLVEKLAK